MQKPPGGGFAPGRRSNRGDMPLYSPNAVTSKARQGLEPDRSPSSRDQAARPRLAQLEISNPFQVVGLQPKQGEVGELRHLLRQPTLHAPVRLGGSPGACADDGPAPHESRLGRNKTGRGNQRFEPQATGRSDRGRPAHIAGQRSAVRYPARNDDVQGDRFMPCGSAKPVGD
jgi:hypothetical protein